MSMTHPIDLGTIERVLVIKLRHIGDVLLTAGAFRLLKNARPSVHITAVVPAGMEDMLTLNPDVDAVLPLERRQGLLKDMAFVRRLRAERFDLAINMTEGDRGALLAFLSRARDRIGIDPRGKGFFGKRCLFTALVSGFSRGRHRAVMDMDVLAPLGIAPAPPEVRLFTSSEHEAFIDALLLEHGLDRRTPFAVVHPSSRWLFKCWRDEGMARTIDHIEGRGIRVVLTCGPDKHEMRRVEAVLAHVTSNPVNLSGQLNLKRLAALLKRCAFFFGVDTAPMHMAAAVGRPVVALFGPSDPRVWGPLTEPRTVIALNDRFPCMPCLKAGCEDSGRSRCLEAVPDDEVLEAIEGMIEAIGLQPSHVARTCHAADV